MQKLKETIKVSKSTVEVLLGIASLTKMRITFSEKCCNWIELEKCKDSPNESILNLEKPDSKSIGLKFNNRISAQKIDINNIISITPPLVNVLKAKQDLELYLIALRIHYIYPNNEEITNCSNGSIKIQDIQKMVAKLADEGGRTAMIGRCKEVYPQTALARILPNVGWAYMLLGDKGCSIIMSHYEKLWGDRVFLKATENVTAEVALWETSYWQKVFSKMLDWLLDVSDISEIPEELIKELDVVMMGAKVTKEKREEILNMYKGDSTTEYADWIRSSWELILGYYSGKTVLKNAGNLLTEEGKRIIKNIQLKIEILEFLEIILAIYANSEIRESVADMKQGILEKQEEIRTEIDNLMKLCQ